MTARDVLRRQMRARRRQVPPFERAAASAAFARIAARTHLLRPGSKLAFYLPYGSEADPSALLILARRCGCTVFVPSIAHYRRRHMQFIRYRPGAALRANRFGIAEPTAHARAVVAARQLDIVFVPLLAVDDRGSRLGSGQGFYDRALRRVRETRRWRRPRLIGVCYQFQRVERIDAERWDVPIDAVITEHGFYPSRRGTA
jgi:5-formyltetrahydrofolate cyclo-ligase